MMAEATAVYTHGHHESVLRSHRWRTAENSAAYVIERVRPGVSLLDVGCGPGTITADLAALANPGHVMAVDSAAEILETAGQVAAERGLDNVAFEVADVHAMRFADDSFDIVHAHQVLQHIAGPVQALREMRRVCRTGGVVAARDADFAAMAWYPEVPDMQEWLSLYHRVARANGGEPDAGRRLLSWARQAGFRDVTCTTATWCYATPEERAWWGGLWADRIVSSDFARLAVSGGHATEQDLRRLSAAWRDWASADDGWFTVLHGEILCEV